VQNIQRPALVRSGKTFRKFHCAFKERGAINWAARKYAVIFISRYLTQDGRTGPLVIEISPQAAINSVTKLKLQQPRIRNTPLEVGRYRSSSWLKYLVGQIERG
jgi:hypothetical protein